MKRLFLTALAVLSLVATASAQTSFKSLVGDVKVADVSDTGPVQLPFITWGGDVATFHANGGGLTTAKDSIFGKSDLDFKMVPGDDFVGQVRDYMSGKSPYLRGTFRMVSMASELMNSDPRTKPHRREECCLWTNARSNLALRAVVHAVALVATTQAASGRGERVSGAI